MSGTHVFYNGVHMQDCEMLEFENVVETDESNTDVKFARFRITVASSIVRLQQGFADTSWVSQLRSIDPNVTTTGFKAPPDSGQSGGLISDIVQRITHDLSQPRQDFLLWINSTAKESENSSVPENNNNRTSSSRIILAATGRIPATNTEKIDIDIGSNQFSTAAIPVNVLRRHVIDANMGPKVTNVRFTNVAGGAFIKVQATFEICRVLYQADASGNIPTQTVTYDARKARGVIFNRWSIVDSMDGDGKVSHEIAGKITVKDHRYKANATRLFVFPFAFAFARMTNRGFTLSEDGLTLGYRYRFEHAGAAPPQYVRDYKAVYTEHCGHATGGKGLQKASMLITVKGWYHRSTDNPLVTMTEDQQKFFLLRGAYTILHSRLRGIDLTWDPIPGHRLRKVNVTDCMVIEQHGKPELELRVDVLYTTPEKGEFHLRLLNMGAPLQIPAYDPRWWPVDNEWGRIPDEDKDNPNFYSTFLTDYDNVIPAKSDYCSHYLQPSFSQRHSLPRITGRTVHANTNTDDIWEWARLDGSIVSSAAESSSTPSPSTTPINQPALTAHVSKDLSGADFPANEPQRTSLPYATGDERTGISQEQREGFTYIQWNSEVLTDSNDGLIMLPLSKVREKPNTPTNYNPIKQTAVAVRLHAGIAKRVYSVVASRIGAWPKMPEPAKIIERSTGDGTSSSYKTVTNTEIRLSVETMFDGVELMADGCTPLFATCCRWTYGLEKPMFADSTGGGVGDYGDNDILPIVNSPITKATFANERIAQGRDVFDNGMIQPPPV